MGDIKLKKGTGILFIMAVLFISSLLYLRYWDQDVLRVGIFYGSNWEVPGTVHYEILDKAIKKFKSKYPNIKGGFMHVPYATSQTVNQPAGTPGMNLNDIARGIELSIEAIIENPTDIMAQGGTTH